MNAKRMSFLPLVPLILTAAAFGQQKKASPDVGKRRVELPVKTSLTNFAKRVTAAGLADARELEKIEQEAVALIEDVVVNAKKAPKPVTADLLTDVYESY